MVEQKKPQYGAIVKSATLVTALLMYTTSMTTPALSDIAAAFPEYSLDTIKLISSIPSLMLCIFSLVSGWLTTKISIKKAILLSSVLIFVGVLPAFFGSSMAFILFTRIVFGAGYGMVFPLCSSVIVDLFDGEEKNQLMGWKSAVGALAGVLFQQMGGLLAVYSWQYVFYGFLLVIPIALYILIFLPDNGVKKVEKSEVEAAGQKGKFTGTLLTFCIVGFLVNSVQFSYMQNMSVIVNDGLGTSLDAANILSTFTGASFVAGLIYFAFAKVCRRYTPAMAVLIIGAAFGIAMTANSLPMLYASAVVFGFGFGFSNPSFTLKAASGVTHPSYSPQAISFYVCSVGIGQFLSAYILTFIRGILGSESVRTDWQVACVALVAGAIIGLIVILIGGKKKETV